MSFDRLIRFVTENDKTVYGNLDTAMAADQIVGLEVQVVCGSLENGFQKTEESAKVKKVRSIQVRNSECEKITYSCYGRHIQLLNPLQDLNPPHVLCAGLNYHEHIKETKVSTVSATMKPQLTENLREWLPLSPRYS